MPSEQTTGQRWAAASGPWRVSPGYRRPAVFERRLVYCNTLRMRFSTKVNPGNWCKVFKTYATWEKCSTCPHNEGFAWIQYNVPKLGLIPTEVPRFRRLVVIRELPDE